MNRRLPTFALLLGIAGLVPFAVCALEALSTTDPARATRFVAALIFYGAVTLAFLGGVHWGLVLEAGPTVRERARLLLGIASSLVGWLALLVWLIGLEAPSLAVLTVGFVALIAAESQLGRNGLMPRAYLLLRWGLSIVVILILATTLTVRLVHARIIF